MKSANRLLLCCSGTVKKKTHGQAFAVPHKTLPSSMENLADISEPEVPSNKQSDQKIKFS